MIEKLPEDDQQFALMFPSYKGADKANVMIGLKDKLNEVIDIVNKMDYHKHKRKVNK